MTDQPSSFAHQFARLVALLALTPDAVDAQKGALRAAVLLVRERAIAIARGGDQIAVNREALSTAISDVGALAARLDAHGVTLLRIEAGAPAAALLAVARRLAAAPGSSADTDGVGGVAGGRLVVPGAARGIAASAAPSAATNGTNAPTPVVVPAGSDAVSAEPAAPAVAAAALVPAAATPAEPLHPEPAAEAPTAVLLEQLAGAGTAAGAARLVDELAARAALAARVGDAPAVVLLLHGALRSLPPGLDQDDPALTAALARLTAADQLDRVCEASASRRADRDRCDTVLAQAPEGGAVLARRLAAADTAADRVVYRDTLVRLRVGAAALTALLDHRDADVAVCAAEGLAAIGGAGSHTALVRALDHANANVRRAAAHALGALGATAAAPALRAALRDGARAVRCEAANALVLLGGSGVGTALADALADERHAEAQLELLAALGRLATAEAVQFLVQAAAPAGRLFGRKAAPFRCAAIAALGVARTPAALAALRELTNDREREVREAVFLAAISASGGPRPRVQQG